MQNRSRRPPRPPRAPEVAPRPIFNRFFVNFGSIWVSNLRPKSTEKEHQKTISFLIVFFIVFYWFLMPKIVPKSSGNRSKSALKQKSAIPWFCSPFHHFLMIFHAQGDQKSKKNRWKSLPKIGPKTNLIFYWFFIDFCSQNRSKNR